MGGADVLDLRNFATTEHLKDGTPVTLRAIRPDDKPRLLKAFRELEPESIYMRFFAHRNALTDEDLRRATEVDFVRDVALVVTVGQGEGETIIGGARYDVFESDGVRSGEIAFTVEEEYQGQGLASRLLRHLIRIAGERGLARLEADVLQRNGAMLAVFSRCGLPMTVERLDDVIHVTLTLAE